MYAGDEHYDQVVTSGIDEPPDVDDPDYDEEEEWEPDPDEARDRHNDDPDLFDSRGRLYRDDD